MARAHRPRRPLLLVAGLLAGAFSGLFGIGGGTVMVPLLLLLPGFDERRATATSLLAIVAMAAAGAALQALHGTLDVPAALLVGLPAAAGAVAGTTIQQRVPARAVTLAFALVLSAVAASLLLGLQPAEATGAPTPAGMLAAALIGTAAGALSGLVGIGGGAILVPVLVLLVGLDQVEAAATSLLAIVPLSLAGALNQRRYGNLDAGAAGLLGLASLPGSALGVTLATALPVRTLQLLFAAVLLLTVVRLLRRRPRLGGVGRAPAGNRLPDARPTPTTRTA